jgi:hypothetical protein
MELTQDDLPTLGIARLRAEGVVTSAMTEVKVSVGGVDATVGLVLRRFANNGSWSLFACPTCGRWVRKLKAYAGRLHCPNCVGLRYRCRLFRSDRTPRIKRLVAQLSAVEPARLNPRPGRMLDRRSKLEASLRRNLHYMRVQRLRGLTKALEDP